MAISDVVVRVSRSGQSSSLAYLHVGYRPNRHTGNRNLLSSLPVELCLTPESVCYSALPTTFIITVAKLLFSLTCIFYWVQLRAHPCWSLKVLWKRTATWSLNTVSMHVCMYVRDISGAVEQKAQHGSITKIDGSSLAGASALCPPSGTITSLLAAHMK